MGRLTATRTIHPAVTCGAFDASISWDNRDLSGSKTLPEFLPPQYRGEGEQ